MFASALRFIKILVIVACCLFAVFAGAMFAFENPETIQPVFWGLSFPPLSLGYYLIFIFLLGLIVGATLSALGSQIRIRKVRQDNRKLAKKMKSLELTESS